MERMDGTFKKKRGGGLLQTEARRANTLEGNSPGQHLDHNMHAHRERERRAGDGRTEQKERDVLMMPGGSRRTRHVAFLIINSGCKNGAV